MAKSMIGLDPLAWLAPAKGAAKKRKSAKKKTTAKKSMAKKATTKKSVAKKSVIKKITTKKAAAKKTVTKKAVAKVKPKVTVNKKMPTTKHVEKYISPLGLDVETLEASFSLLEPQADVLVETFYKELFSQHPDVVPMFANTTPESQQKKLLASLKLVIANLRKPDVLADALKNLGSKHQAYGAEPDHYNVVAKTLMAVMQNMAGDVWTKQVQDAWQHAFNIIAEVMLGAYEDISESEAEITVSEPEESTVNESTVVLGGVQDISMVAELHTQVGALINTQDIVFDGSEVERIDASTLQLIACAFKQAEKYDNKVSWQGTSDALKKSAGLLGLSKALNL